MALMRGRGGRRGPAAVATLVIFIGMLAMAGLGLFMVGTSDSGAEDRGGSAPESTRPTLTPSPSVSTIGRSKPVRLGIPAMDVDNKMSKISLRKNKKSLQLPPKPRRAAWFDRSVSPGEMGPSIVVGYIDAGERGPGVFRKLRKLRSGHAIYLTRADGKIAAYRVQRVKSYPPGKLPVKKVYGGTKQAALRIVTCGGSMTKSQPPANVVVYARLVHVQES
ncbi:MAG: sortase [Streptosporangiales bacterium]|nr:sortase [Streptosporangiales bacterium]